LGRGEEGNVSIFLSALREEGREKKKEGKGGNVERGTSGLHSTHDTKRGGKRKRGVQPHQLYFSFHFIFFYCKIVSADEGRREKGRERKQQQQR